MKENSRVILIMGPMMYPGKLVSFQKERDIQVDMVHFEQVNKITETTTLLIEAIDEKGQPLAISVVVEDPPYFKKLGGG